MQECFKFGMGIDEYYDASPREIYNFLSGRAQKVKFEIEQGWDYVRWIMIGAMIPYSNKTIKPTDIIRLDRDRPKAKGLSPYQQQQLDRWSAEMDKQMGIDE